jgi:hypothetical protein
MDFKKATGRFLIVMMLAMQVALAQHATVHSAEGMQQHAPAQGQHRDHAPDKDKLCQICLLSKDFAKILTPSNVQVADPIVIGIRTLILPQAVLVTHSPSVYTARAPPGFSA